MRQVRPRSWVGPRAFAAVDVAPSQAVHGVACVGTCDSCVGTADGPTDDQTRESATQTEHAQHERIAQTLAGSKGSIVHTAQSAHQLHHASADRTLRTLQDGDAKVVSPEGVVHVGKGIVKRDVLYNEVCTCCAKYKQTAPAVRAGVPARRAASGDACSARE